MVPKGRTLSLYAEDGQSVLSLATKAALSTGDLEPITVVNAGRRTRNWGLYPGVETLATKLAMLSS
jgi:hypothetical protein